MLDNNQIITDMYLHTIIIPHIMQDVPSGK